LNPNWVFGALEALGRLAAIEASNGPSRRDAKEAQVKVWPLRESSQIREILSASSVRERIETSGLE
jgi:hypothetical protein